MNTINMLINNLRVESPKKENPKNESVLNKSKDSGRFNEILNKTVSAIAKNAKEVDSNTQVFEKSLDLVENSTKIDSGDLKEEDEVKDSGNDNNQVNQLMALLNMIMNSKGDELLNLNFDNIDTDSSLDLTAISGNEGLTSLLSNIDGDDKKLLLMLKLMTSTNTDDMKSYLKENLNLSSAQIESITKLLSNANAIGNEKPSHKENVSAIKGVFENITKGAEQIETVGSDKSALLSEQGEDTNTSAKEETLLKSIINGSNGVKNLGMKDIILNQPAKVTEQPTINKSKFTEDIVKSIKYMDLNNLKELTVKIAPKELGELVIKVSIEAGMMKANLSAANKEAYELLSANFKDISDKLQNSNIKIGEVNINLYEDDTTFFSDDSRKENFNNQEKKHKGQYQLQKEEEKKEKEAVDTSNLSYVV